jgi:hypothetical protein
MIQYRTAQLITSSENSAHFTFEGGDRRGISLYSGHSAGGADLRICEQAALVAEDALVMDGNSRAVTGGRARKPLRLLAHTTAADE